MGVMVLLPLPVVSVVLAVGGMVVLVVLVVVVMVVVVPDRGTSCSNGNGGERVL